MYYIRIYSKAITNMMSYSSLYQAKIAATSPRIVRIF